MAYLVRIASRAERDLELLYQQVSAADSLAARRWYEGLKRKVLSLSLHPNRSSVTPENNKLRHLLYGRKPHTYRVIYRVDERLKRVDVLHIRHGARRGFRSQDVA